MPKIIPMIECDTCDLYKDKIERLEQINSRLEEEVADLREQVRNLQEQDLFHKDRFLTPRTGVEDIYDHHQQQDEDIMLALAEVEEERLNELRIDNREDYLRFIDVLQNQATT
ncbi:hypothetical protein PCE1_004541 [Barthelona sp. PCE]